MSNGAQVLITCTLCGILHSAPSLLVNNPVCPECRVRRGKRVRPVEAVEVRSGSRGR
jgi:hypothetical protein